MCVCVRACVCVCVFSREGGFQPFTNEYLSLCIFNYLNYCSSEILAIEHRGYVKAKL